MRRSRVPVRHDVRMPTAPGDFDLTLQELRVVARFVTESAEAVLPVFAEEPRVAGRARSHATTRG